MRHREVPTRLIFSVASLYMLVIPDYTSKSIRSGNARVPLRLASVCRLFHLHLYILVTSQRSVMLMTLFPLHSRCVRRRHVHIILSLYPFLFEPFLPQLAAPHGSPHDIPFSSVYCCCSIEIGYGPPSIRVHKTISSVSLAHLPLSLRRQWDPSLCR